MRVRWLAKAAASLDYTLTYVATENPAAAENLRSEIERVVENLALFPRIGRFGSDFDTYRLPISRTPYVLHYRIVRDEVQMLRLMHHAQKWPSSG